MKLTSISSLQDNYIWVLSTDALKCVIVDPGDAAPVFAAIAQHGWHPEAILLTHHHADHVAGVAELKQRYPDLAVYGPAETKDKGITQCVKEGDKLHLLGHTFTVMDTPGHTLGHISYYSAPYLFCGDTLFSAGCGRLLGGSAQQMYDSLQKINKLPPETLICCAHEYTESNIKFALSLVPEDQQINSFHRKVKMLRAENRPTVPTTLALERQVNLFLRTEDPELKRKIQKDSNLQQPCDIFTWLRAKKDNF